MKDNRNPLTTAIRYALGACMVAGLAATGAPVLAQDNDEGEDAADLDRIQVTGSRLQTNPNLAAANPVLSVTGEEVDVRGNVRIEDFVNQLPQVFAGQASEVSNGASGTATLNLRGLGSARTLVLINGRRLPYGSSTITSANLDLIPTQLIERVDILTGGASAVYGSDAVGGVANFIMRDNYEGFEVGYSMNISQAENGVGFWDNVTRAADQPVPGSVWDGEEFIIHATMGANTADGRGNVMVHASYEEREEILQADRSISACALGQSTGSSSFGGFGCVGSANFRLFGGPGGFAFQEEDGNIVPFAGGPAQTFNFGSSNFFQRPSERFSIFGRAKYDVTDNVEAFLDASFYNNFSDAQIAPSASFGIGAYNINCGNPLIQGGQGIPLTEIFGCSPEQIANDAIVGGITASHRNVEGGERNSRLENSAWRFVGGLRGTVAEHWDWEVFGQIAETRDEGISTEDFVVANLQQSLLVTTDANGNPVCIDPSGGCVPYNIFQRGAGGESLVTQEALGFVQGVGITLGSTKQTVMGADIQADLGNYGISSPFSDLGVGLLLGFEYRKDELESTPDEISQVPGGGFTGVGGATLPVSGTVDVTEFFAETQVPIISDAPFARELTLTAQYRYSDYSTSGNDTSGGFTTDAYGAALTWAPIEDVRLRAQYQRAVRAPSVIALFTGQNTNLPNLSPAGVNANGEQLFDPCASDAPIASLEACQRTGVTAAQYGTILDVISGQTQSLTGGNPELQPEVADTYTYGIVFQPEAVPGLSISVDYFDITVEDAIAAGIPAQTTLNNCLATGDPTFCSLINRADSGTLAAGGFGVGFQQTNINIAELSTAGVDAQVQYNLDVGDMGAVNLNFAATWLDSLDTVPFPGADAIECAGKFGGQCGSPSSEYRHRLLATWSTPWNVDISGTMRHFSGTDNDDSGDTLESSFGTVNYFDFSAAYQLTETFGVRGGVLNAFDRTPPVFSGAGPALGNGNTYPTVFDTSRVWFASITANL